MPATAGHQEENKMRAPAKTPVSPVTAELEMTPEQLENLARFAGITIEEDGVDVNGLTWHWSPELDKHWCPDVDWNDFGPLWMKLGRWVATNNAKSTYDLFDAYDNFYTAKNYGTEQDLMQAGCLLGAAIGATMGDK
jgi:hypothetical protein